MAAAPASSDGGAIEIDAQAFWSRLNRFVESWKGSSWGADSVLIITGGSSDELYLKSVVLHTWLFGYELTETALLFTKEQLYILTSAKKVSLLQPLEKAKEGTVGMTLLTRNKADNDAENFAKLMQTIQQSKSDGKPTVGTLLKEKPQGALVTAWQAKFADAAVERIDISPALSAALGPKDQKELKSVRTAAAITSHILKHEVVPKLLTIIDDEQKVTHAEFSNTIEQLFNEPQKISKKLTADLLESCYTPLVQSGGKYDLHLGAEASQQQLHFGTILLSFGTRYKSYCSNVSRTFFVDPEKDQEQAYQLVLDLQEHLLHQLRPGTKASKIMAAARRFIQSSKQPHLEKYLYKNVGFAMGIDFKDSNIIFSDKCDAEIKAGMVFNLSVGLQNIERQAKDEKKKIYSILVADTVLVNKEGEPEVLTEKCQKKYADVSFFLEGEDEAGKQASSTPAAASAPKPAEKPAPKVEVEKIIESKFRESTLQRMEDKEKSMESEARRREHQRQLEEKQRQEAAERFKAGKHSGSRRVATLEAKDIQAYKDPTAFPKDALPNKIYVDPQAESILLPINGHLVPFHIAFIKNVSKMDEEYLRINFITPDAQPSLGLKGPQAGQVSLPEPKKAHLKEITYRFADPRALNNQLRMIKEVRKRFTVRQTEVHNTATLVEQEKLVLSKGRCPRLQDVFVRPYLTGRKTPGTLEAHVNGFRFLSSKGLTLDIMYKNIEHAFFQPAENDYFVLVHFHLHNEIMIGKKKTKDVQFCAEVVEASQALDKRTYEAEEIEEEQREKELKTRLNAEFQSFVKKVEEAGSGIEFDIPYHDLGFYGVPFRSQVYLQPSVHALVSLTEQPFFILTLEEVEIAYFERVQFNVRNFDLVFVFKDYEKPVQHINSIDAQYLETIKEWLDSCDIKYYEGTQSLNWNRIMATVREDPEAFHTEEGGWSFLNPDSDEEGSEGEGSDEQESDYAPEEEEVASEESDEYESESEEDSWEEDEEEDDYSGEEEEDEEGMDWDEMEEEAKKADKQLAAKRSKRGRDYDSDDDDDAPKKKSAGKPQAKGSAQPVQKKQKK